MKLKSWIKAARLRTLPLSLSGIVIGSATAYYQGFWDNWIFILAISTTLFLQILSNYANDLGDSYKGADNADRLGPQRAVQSGEITKKQMLYGVIFTALLSFTTAIPLIIIGVQGMPKSVLYFYLLLALLCVVAAITYTIGKKAYGYHGLGDVMVFIFFGLVSVLGVYSLYTKQFDFALIGLAIGIGCLSVAVLNLNNMRDHENDERVGKNTLVVKIGFKKGKIYHSFLIFFALLNIVSVIVYYKWWMAFVAVLPFIVLLQHLQRVWKVENPQELDKEMKKVALSTFAISILFFISSLI